MKLFEIRDDDLNDMLVGYLMYFTRTEEFYVELPEGIEELDAPFMFARHAREKRYSVDKYWSRRWVNSRIVPPDRQNIGEILKVNGLKVYDPYRLLVIADGRCAQDENYIKRADMDKIPDWFYERMKRKVRDIIVTKGNKLVVFFEDGTTRIVDVTLLRGDDRIFGKILRDSETFSLAEVMSGGNGVQWDDERYIVAEELYSAGEAVNFPFEYMINYVNDRVVDTGEATELMHVSRQYINRMVAYNTLLSVKKGRNSRLFLKSDLRREV